MQRPRMGRTANDPSRVVRATLAKTGPGNVSMPCPRRARSRLHQLVEEGFGSISPSFACYRSVRTTKWENRSDGERICHWCVMSRPNSTDATILRLLQDNARERLDTMASETGLSVATVQRRIRNLKKTGAIEGERALISPKAVGYTMTFLVLVELERERVDQLDAFRRRVKAEPRVQQCYYITGEADFALIVLARDMQDFQELTHRLFFDDANVKRFRTSVVMDRTKVGLTVPLA